MNSFCGSRFALVLLVHGIEHKALKLSVNTSCVYLQIGSTVVGETVFASTLALCIKFGKIDPKGGFHQHFIIFHAKLLGMQIPKA